MILKVKLLPLFYPGDVKINNEVITKSGLQIDPGKKFNIEIKSMPYVSRGGFKLEKAIKTFDVKIKDRICIDAGASTGGFSDCLLQNGTKKFMRLMWDTDNWRGRLETMKGLR